jgi:phospholipid/cholesterol/gamma-HCH transport system substrate-binding protein
MTREFRLGLFVVGTLAILMVGVLLIGKNSSLFRSTYQLKSNLQNASGLIDGAEVRVGGIREGTVKSIQLPRRPNDQVTLVMNLEKATRAVLKKDSVATIQSEGLLGDKFVEISFGSPDGADLKDGDTIGSQPTLEVADLIKKANQLLDNAQNSLQTVDATASNLEAISSKINQGKGTVGALINDPSMYNKVTQGATSFADDMEALKHNFLLRGFFKKRGYEDAEELKKHAISRLPAEAPIKTFAYDGEKIFDKPTAAKLKNAKVLNDAGSFLESNKYGLVVVAAYAGLKGDTAKQRLLTEGRGTAVRDYLAQNFKLDDTRIKTLGMGKAQDPDDSDKIEIVVFPPATSAAQASKR